MDAKTTDAVFDIKKRLVCIVDNISNGVFFNVSADECPMCDLCNDLEELHNKALRLDEKIDHTTVNALLEETLNSI